MFLHFSRKTDKSRDTKSKYSLLPVQKMPYFSTLRDSMIELKVLGSSNTKLLIN